MSKVYLITAQPRIAATGAATTVRLAGGGSRKGYYYGGQHFRAGVALPPRLSAQIRFDENGWTGGVVPTSSGIIWAPYGKVPLAELAALYWRNAIITIEEGDEEAAVFTTRLSGKVADATVQGHKLVITVADPSEGLSRPLVTARFAGTGGAEGGSEAKDRIKRRTWGRAFNIEGRILDKANNVYEFGDPAFQWQAIDVLRDKGRDASPAPAVVTWQGSIATTLAALVAAVPVPGSGVVAPSIACCKWWKQPSGPLTADVRGEIGTGYVETAPGIAAQILSATSGPAITNAATAAGWRAGAAGIQVDEQETISAVLDRLLMGVSLLWIFNPNGTITLREFTFSSPVASLVSDTVERLKTLPPVRTRRLAYQRAYRVHSDAEIAVSDSSGIPVSLATFGAGVIVDNNTLSLTGAASGGYNQGAVSLNTFTGAAYCEGKLSGAHGIFGLTTNSGANNTLNVGSWALFGGNAIALAANGATALASAAADTSAVYAVRCDGVTTTWLKNGAVVASAAAASATQIIYAKVAFNVTGTAVTALRFEPHNNAAWDSIAGAKKPDDFADVTYQFVGAPSSQVVAKADGTFDIGVLAAAAQSATVQAKSGDVTTSFTYAVSATAGSGTATVALTGGKAVLTPATLPETTTFEVTASLNGTARAKWAHTMTKKMPAGASGSTGSGSGTAASAPIGGTSNSTTPVALANIIKVKAGANGQVVCTAPLSYVRQEATSGSAVGAVVWKWRVLGGTLVDITTAIVGTTTQTLGGVPQDPGYADGNMTKTGLTDGVEYEFQPYGYRNSGTGTLTFQGADGASATCTGT
ncbi:MAG: hypothetical protein QOI38_3121 [Sphingomonadales bacterium]|jgi:hypothetical protein|nr:hypothetical protein [Sphingomonadales bacterium]